MTDAAAIARELAPLILEQLREQRIDGLWSLADVARWFAVSDRKARDIVATPGFPRADPLPPGDGHPRWLAAEVVEWWSKRRG